MAATGGTLLERVRRLMSGSTTQHTPAAHALVTATIIALVVLVVGGGSRWSSRTLQARDRDGKPSGTETRRAEASTTVASIASERTEKAIVDPAPRALQAIVSVPVAAVAEPAPQIPAVDKEKELDDALRLDNPPKDMPLAVEVNYFMLNRAEYSVPLAMRIPGSELALALSQGAARTTIDFVGEVKDAYGTPVQNLRDKVDIRLGDASAAQLEARPILYQAAFILLPGRYDLRLAARDAETGRIGTFRTSFQIPNLNREEKTIPISTVVLGSQLVRMNDEPTARPDSLVYDGQKLIPSVTRVFSTSQDMYVFLQAYRRDATATQPLVASVILSRAGVKVFETVPVPITAAPEGRSNAVSVRLAVPLAGFAPGAYECEVTLLDPGGPKLTLWHATVTLVP
jgi:hypothetical protein